MVVSGDTGVGGWRGGARLHPGVPDEQRAAEDQGEVCLLYTSPSPRDTR
ncbi:hypothetical protein KZ850_32910 [Pseudomonas aeruginosa]|nr:hypothetical protein [Pseudomonas aeruginosa]